MSIRTRLTLWYSAILAMVLLLFGAAVYAVMSYTLVQNVDSALQEAARNIQSKSRENIERGGTRKLLLPNIDASIESVSLIQVMSLNGDVEASNLEAHGNIQELLVAQKGLLDPNSLATMRADPVRQRGGPLFRTVQLEHNGSMNFRVITLPLTGDQSGVIFGYLQVAQSEEDIDRAKRTLLFTLLLVGTIALVMSAAAGVAMAQRALQPVDSITQTVLEIYKAEDLNQRVPVQANDEVGRMAGAFNDMLERLRDVFRSQQRLVADVSHELRTPLTVIRGNAELMRNFGTLDRESLDAITKETDRMTRMVGNLLLLSQADVGQLPMKVQELDLAHIVSDVERSAIIMSAGKVDIESGACSDLIIQGDSDRIKQVLLNLVDNAIKHTPDGGKVTLNADCPDGLHIKLSVSDSGLGIPQQDLPHVFERFYRVDKARSREQGGAGLGLAIVKSFVDAHGGRIEVQSQVGRGTTFIVWLPAYQPDVL